MRELFLLTTLLLSIALLSIHIAYGDSAFGVGGVEWIRRPSYPGDVGVVSLDLYYTGDRTLVGVSIEARAKGSAEVLGERIEFSSWEPGETKEVEIALKVEEIGRELELFLSVKWELEVEKKAGGVEVSEGGSRTLVVDLEIPGEPRLSVLVEPLVLAPDSANSLRVVVENEGRERVENLRMRIEPEGLTILRSPVPLIVEIRALDPGESRSLEIVAIPLIKTPSLRVRLEYVYRGRLEVLEIVENLYSGPTGYLLVSVEPTVVEAGGPRDIAIIVENRGVVSARSVVLKLYPPLEGLLVLNETKLELGDIEPSNKTTTRISVLVPAEARGCRRIEYELSYTTPGGGQIKETGRLVLGIVAPVELSVVSIDIVPREALVNKTLVVSLTIVNLGTSEARDVNATLILPKGIEAVRRTHSYVGCLAPQDLTTVAFSLVPEREGEFEVEYAIYFADPYGIEHVLTGSFGVEVESAEDRIEASAPVEILYASAAVLASISVAYALLLKKYGVKKR